MKLPAVDFTNPNNSALSLRTLAELVRAGDLACVRHLEDPDIITLNIAVRIPTHPAKEKSQCLPKTTGKK